MKTGGQVIQGYMGSSGWKGANIDEYGYLSYKDINKIVVGEMRKLYPGVKFSARGRSYANGQSTTFRIYLRYEDAFLPDEIVRNNYLNDVMRYRSHVRYRDENGDLHYGFIEELTPKQKSSAADVHLEFLKQRETYQLNQFSIGENQDLKPEVIEMVKKARGLMMSFIHDESNGMVDYFDRNLYDDYEIVIQ